ncbi:early activation antigen CD69-like isoform X2 [Mytilus californianus]|uniref:early activation antigen CD69-like isoform X2 n=1 Tax=Mytilus californianus TaxID=6549 RepID=UPI002245F9E6|nr:early activation antigen CD69-like isoform X2 [Mytilus californianus]
MKSSSIKLSVILVMLYPLAIEMKSKRCHKQPNPGVPDDVTEPYFLLFGGSRYYFVKAELQTYPQAKATCLDMCATLVEINNEAENNFIILNAERLGQVSPWIGLESKDGTSYEWASGNTTESNLYDNWSNTNTIIYGVGRCVFMNVSNKEWLSKAQSTCNSVKDEFICEFLDLINNHDKT